MDSSNPFAGALSGDMDALMDSQHSALGHMSLGKHQDHDCCDHTMSYPTDLSLDDHLLVDGSLWESHHHLSQPTTDFSNEGYASDDPPPPPCMEPDCDQRPCTANSCDAGCTSPECDEPICVDPNCLQYLNEIHPCAGHCEVSTEKDDRCFDPTHVANAVEERNNAQHDHTLFDFNHTFDPSMMMHHDMPQQQLCQHQHPHQHPQQHLHQHHCPLAGDDLGSSARQLLSLSTTVPEDFFPQAMAQMNSTNQSFMNTTRQVQQRGMSFRVQSQMHPCMQNAAVYDSSRPGSSLSSATSGGYSSNPQVLGDGSWHSSLQDSVMNGHNPAELHAMLLSPTQDSCNSHMADFSMRVPSTPASTSTSGFLDHPSPGMHPPPSKAVRRRRTAATKARDATNPYHNHATNNVHAVQPGRPREQQKTCLWVANPDDAPEHWHVCDRTFDSALQLQEHYQMHIAARNEQSEPRDRRYLCFVQGCDRFNNGCFKQTSKLKRHMRSHSKHCEYDCEFPGCDQSFTTREQLRNHEVVHTKEKPFKCKYCDHWSTTKSQNNTHERSHEGDAGKKHSCPICEYRTTDSSNLSKHMKTHDELIFRCIHAGCDFFSRRFEEVKKHWMSSQHCREYRDNGSAAQLKYKEQMYDEARQRRPQTQPRRRRFRSESVLMP